MKKIVGGLRSDPIVDEKRRLLDRIIAGCLGLSVETRVANAEIVPGESVELHHQVEIRSGIPVRWIGVRYPSLGREMRTGIDLAQGKPSLKASTQILPAGTVVSQPYWLREEGTAGMFRVDDASLIGRPEDPPILPVEYLFQAGGQAIALSDEPVAPSRIRRGPRSFAASRPFPRFRFILPPASSCSLPPPRGRLRWKSPPTAPARPAS